MPKKRTKKVKRIILTIVTLCFVFCGVYLVNNYFYADKIVYGIFIQNYDDQYTNDYLEKNANFEHILYEPLGLEETLLPFRIVSNAAGQKIEYLSPFLLYVLVRPYNVKEIKSINKNLAAAKNNFAEALTSLTTKSVNYKVDSSQGRYNDVQAFYYNVFLPRYLDYITAKQNLSLFAQKVLAQAGVIGEPFINIMRLQDLLIEAGTTFVLPSILKSENSNTDFEKILFDTNIVSLVRACNEFELVKTQNKFQLNSGRIVSFENALYAAEEALKSARDIFNSLSLEHKTNYLKSNKTRPESLPSVVSPNFNETFMAVIMAKNNGTLIEILNDGRIDDYFTATLGGI